MSSESGSYSQLLLILLLIIVAVCAICLICYEGRIWYYKWYATNPADNNNNNNSICTISDQEHPYHMLPKAHRDLFASTKVAIPQRDIEEARSFRQNVLKECGTLDHIPPFNPDFYNGPPHEELNNCYRYAMADMNTKYKGKPQPGMLSGQPHLTKAQLTCANIIRYAKLDYPDILDCPDAITPCPCGYFKVYLMLADKERNQHDNDYHWIRQDRNGFYSGKPGSTPITSLDAAGKYIANPDRSNFNYSAAGGPNYCTSCGYFCVPHTTEKEFEDNQHKPPTEWQTTAPTTYERPRDYVPGHSLSSHHDDDIFGTSEAASTNVNFVQVEVLE